MEIKKPKLHEREIYCPGMFKGHKTGFTRSVRLKDIVHASRHVIDQDMFDLEPGFVHLGTRYQQGDARYKECRDLDELGQWYSSLPEEKVMPADHPSIYFVDKDAKYAVSITVTAEHALPQAAIKEMQAGVGLFIGYCMIDHPVMLASVSLLTADAARRLVNTSFEKTSLKIVSGSPEDVPFPYQYSSSPAELSPRMIAARMDPEPFEPGDYYRSWTMNEHLDRLHL